MGVAENASLFWHSWNLCIIQFKSYLYISGYAWNHTWLQLATPDQLLLQFHSNSSTCCSSYSTNSKWKALTYSAWRHLRLILLCMPVFAGGDWKKVWYQGEKCMCAFPINVSGSVHSTGPIRGLSSAVCCLVASTHQQKHAQTKVLRSRNHRWKIQIISPSVILRNNLTRSGTIIRKEARWEECLLFWTAEHQWLLLLLCCWVFKSMQMRQITSH